MPQILSLQRHPKVLITISDLQNPTISPQPLIGLILLHQTAASTSRSISNMTYKGSQIIKHMCLQVKNMQS
jgi:hypothetical protein